MLVTPARLQICIMSKKRGSSVDIGTLGEDEFRLLCSHSGLIANASNNDRLGWDFFVEIPPLTNLNIPLDQQPSLQKALFQIKLTKIITDRVRGKLSAFKYLADTELPSFIAHQMFNAENKIMKIRILHIGKIQIEMILRQVRKAESEGRIDLHKMDISLSLSDAVAINPCQESLIDAVYLGIDHFRPVYGKAKMDFRAACGFDKNSISASLSFKDVDIHDFADLMLGLRSELPFSHMDIQKRRFGIATGSDSDHLKEVNMSVHVKPFQTGFVRALALDGFRRSELLAELFTPNIPGLEKKDFRIRIKNEAFDAILHLGGGKSKISFIVDTNKYFELCHLSDILNFGTLLCEEGTRLFIDFPALKDRELPIPEEFTGVWRWRLAAELLNIIVPRAAEKLPRCCNIDMPQRCRKCNRVKPRRFASIARPGLMIVTRKPEELDQSIQKYGTVFIPTAILFQIISIKR